MIEKETSRTPVKVVGISGSLRKGSYTKKVVQLALDGAAENGAETCLIDLQDYNLIFCGAVEDEADYPEDVFRLRRQVKEAQGIILGTPEYHGSLSGVLKNALDLMSFNEIEGKMMGLVGVSGGNLGAINALNSLRNIGRSLHAWVLPQQVSVPEAANYFDSRGNLVDEELKDRLQEVGRLIARFSTLHNIGQGQEFIRMWESLPVNPGGRKKS